MSHLDDIFASPALVGATNLQLAIIIFAFLAIAAGIYFIYSRDHETAAEIETPLGKGKFKNPGLVLVVFGFLFVLGALYLSTRPADDGKGHTKTGSQTTVKPVKDGCRLEERDVLKTEMRQVTKYRDELKPKDETRKITADGKWAMPPQLRSQANMALMSGGNPQIYVNNQCASLVGPEAQVALQRKCSDGELSAPTGQCVCPPDGTGLCTWQVSAQCQRQVMVNESVPYQTTEAREVPGKEFVEVCD